MRWCESAKVRSSLGRSEHGSSETVVADAVENVDRGQQMEIGYGSNSRGEVAEWLKAAVC